MPSYVVPWKLGAHRTAGIALFRALLSQVRRLPLGEEERSAIQNVVRHRFKARRFDQSFERLRESFQAGYQALGLIDACTAGEHDKTEQLREILSRIPERLKRRPKQAPLLKVPKHKGAQAALTGKSPSSILDRPRLSLSGVRRIPVLFTTQDIPFLRITKPQPESLSGYIRGRKKQRRKRNDKLIEMQSHLQVCENEDAWDSIVREECGLKDAQGSFVSWTFEVHRTMKQVTAYIAAEKAKNMSWAKKLLAVVDRERELAEQESEARQTAGR